MGFTGVSRADDENTVSVNPAGLGIHNDRYKRLSFMYSVNPKTMNPAVENNRFYEHTLSFCSQPSSKNIGGFGLLFNLPVWNPKDNEEKMIIDCVNQMPDSVSTTDKYLQLQTNLILSYSHDLSFIHLENHSLGMSFRLTHVYNSFLGIERTNNAAGMDIGYSGTFFDRLHLGLVFSHLDLYTEREEYLYQQFPRFTGALGVHGLFSGCSRGKVSLFIESNYAHYLRYNRKDFHLWRNEMVNTGFDLTVFYFFYIRSGLSYDFHSHDKIVPWGFGLNFFNRYMVNFFHTAYATQETDKKRFGISLSVINLFE